MDVKKDKCIKNNFSYKIYKIFPFFYEYPAELIRDEVSLGTSTKINPFFICIKTIIENNTHQGLSAMMAIANWKRT